MKAQLAYFYSCFGMKEYYLAGRILILIWLVKIVFFSPKLASDYPKELIIPTGLLSFMSEEVVAASFSFVALSVLKILMTVILVIFLVRISSAWIGLGTVLLLQIYTNISHSFGSFIYHVEVALHLILIIYVISLFAGQQKSDKIGQQQTVLFFLLSAIVVTLHYALIGTYRLINGGIDLFISDYIVMIVLERSVERVDYTFTIGQELVNLKVFPSFLKAGFILTTFFEILSPMVLFSQKFRYLWVAVIIPFHMSTLFLMNIFFWENVVMIMILFTGMLNYKLFEYRKRNR